LKGESGATGGAEIPNCEQITLDAKKVVTWSYSPVLEAAMSRKGA
jgi:hypothetical protein